LFNSNYIITWKGITIPYAGTEDIPFSEVAPELKQERGTPKQSAQAKTRERHESAMEKIALGGMLGTCVTGLSVLTPNTVDRKFPTSSVFTSASSFCAEYEKVHQQSESKTAITFGSG
jgi:hypothetical protein